MPDNGRMVLGGPQQPQLPETVEPEVTPEKAYINTLGNNVDKMKLLSESLKKASDQEQAKASLVEIGKLNAKFGSKKDEWLEKLAGFPQAWEDGSESTSPRVTESLDALKKGCDQEQKSLTKALAPHRMWAKNAGMLYTVLTACGKATHGLESQTQRLKKKLLLAGLGSSML